MRGEDHLPVGTLKPMLRNTPTCVGKTQKSDGGLMLSWKHPHMRGEDFSTLSTLGSTIETPPHAWGRPNTFRPNQAHYRNTPTCVGKTIVNINRCTQVKKHPHMRG